VGWYGFWTYYLFTGDQRTIAEAYPAVRTYLGLWQVGTDGLVRHRAGDWDWPDWGKNADVAVLDNAWYYLALKAASAMAAAAGHAEEVEGYSTQMRVLAASFARNFWQGGSYRSPAHTGDTDDRAQALAVVAGLAKPEQYPAIRRVLAEKTYASPYMEKYVLESLFQMGAPEEALQRMKTRYARILADASSTLWENFGGGADRAGPGTRNHAWSGGPLTILSQYAAGIAPTVPGWKEFSVRPQPGPLTAIASTVPTPHGSIEFALHSKPERLQMDLTVPPGTVATVFVPSAAGENWRELRLNGRAPEGSSSRIRLSEGRHKIEARR
jgi:glycogen debranching enzyme